MHSQNEIGLLALHIAESLWPSLKSVTLGSALDIQGTDATWRNGSQSIQVKGDRRMYETRNVCLELFKRTYDGHREPYSVSKPQSRFWRASMGKPDIWIFVTQGWAIWIPANAMATAATGVAARQILDTSVSLLIPVDKLTKCDNVQLKTHDMWTQKVLL